MGPEGPGVVWISFERNPMSHDSHQQSRESYGGGGIQVPIICVMGGFSFDLRKIHYHHGLWATYYVLGFCREAMIVNLYRWNTSTRHTLIFTLLEVDSLGD